MLFKVFNEDTMQTYQDTQLLQKVVIRVPKHQSSFCYFILESNEGIAFYSTMPSSLKKQYRDIEIYSPIELKDNLSELLAHLNKQVDLNILINESIVDQI